MSTTLPGASSGIDTTQGGGGGWYAFLFKNGAIGIQHIAPGTHGPSDGLRAQFIAPYSTSWFDVMTNYTSALNHALGSIGGSIQQLGILTHEIDNGAGLSDNLSWLYVGKDGSVSSNVSTKTGSDATPINQIPSPISPNVGNEGGGLAGSISAGLGGLGSFFGMLGDLQFWKGIGLVLAGAAILVVAAMELRKL